MSGPIMAERSMIERRLMESFANLAEARAICAHWTAEAIKVGVLGASAPAEPSAEKVAEKVAEDRLEETLNGGRVMAKTTIQGVMGGVQIRAEVETGPGVACLLLIGEDDLRRFVREECAKISAAANQAPKRVMDGMGGFNPVEPTPASDLQGGG